MKRAIRLFLIGGTAYVLMEKWWRGRSHWTMFVLGGLCFHLIGGVSLLCRGWKRWQKCALCAVLVTAAEYLCGCLVNRRWHMKVWDYSRRPMQVKGQICLLYSLLWGALSAVAMPFYRICRRIC